MNKAYDLVAYTTGSYQDKEGNEKRRSVNIGRLIEGEKNGKPYKFITLYRHINLAAFQFDEGSDAVTVSIYEPKKEPYQGKRTVSDVNSYKGQPTAGAPDDEIPF